MKLLRRTLAAPLKLVLSVCNFFPKVDKLRLIKIIWEIGREPEYARGYIFLTHVKKGIESARETGEIIFKEYPSDQVAGIMGVMEFNEYNLISAKEWLEKGRQCPEENPETLLFLELELSDHLDGYNTAEVISKILSRKDLSMVFTRSALATKAELFLRARKWDEADAILERILHIEEIPQLRWMKWTVAKARGDEREAQRQLNLSKTKKQKEVPNIFMALGWYYLGDIGKTREYLTKARKDGITKMRITQINRELGSMLEEDAFERQLGETN